jgi:hypothetical protein
MKLRHSTPSRNVASILTKGLDPVYAVTRSDKKFVWLHTPWKTLWAVRHTSRRKHVFEDEVVILEVNVPRAWLWRVWPGVWKCPDLIPPHRLQVME